MIVCINVCKSLWQLTLWKLHFNHINIYVKMEDIITVSKTNFLELKENVSQRHSIHIISQLRCSIKDCQSKTDTRYTSKPIWLKWITHLSPSKHPGANNAGLGGFKNKNMTITMNIVTKRKKEWRTHLSWKSHSAWCNTLIKTGTTVMWHEWIKPDQALLFISHDILSLL